MNRRKRSKKTEDPKVRQLMLGRQMEELLAKGDVRVELYGSARNPKIRVVKNIEV